MSAKLPITPKHPHSEQMNPTPVERPLLATLLVVVAVVLVHLIPLCGLLGVQCFCDHFWESTTLAFCFFSAFTLTVRVLFLENRRIHRLLEKLTIGRIIVIQVIGAAVAIAWLAPIYAVAHGIAEMSVAAIGVVVSILMSTIVKGGISRQSLLHDIAPVLTILFGMIWSSNALGHAQNTSELLMAVTVGASSVHGWGTVVDYIAKAFSRAVVH
jgi:hypothetical protein